MSDHASGFDVSIETSDEQVTVVLSDAQTACTAVVRRVGETAIRSSIPIGTRDAECLEMVVGDRPVVLTPGPGELTRSSFQVTAVLGGITFTLEPVTGTSSRFLRDGAHLGDLSRLTSGEIVADWAAGAAVELEEAALGLGLAAAFGTGAGSLFGAVFEGLFGIAGGGGIP